MSVAPGFAKEPADPALEQTVRIYESAVTAPLSRKAASFAVNPELGRAWVVLSVEPTQFDDALETKDILVPGLFFDAAAAAVFFRSDEHVVKCATARTKGRGPLKRVALDPTGRCKLLSRIVRVPFDDGTAIRPVPRYELHLKIRS